MLQNHQSMKLLTTTRQRVAELKTTDRIAYFLLLLWVISMIALPNAWWMWGDSILPLGVTISAIFQAATVFVMLSNQWRLSKTTWVFLLVALLSWTAEFIGSTTGIPFGAYHYTERLQPQIFAVPLLIPVAWFMLLPPSWAIAHVIVGEQKTFRQKLAFIMISAAALTAWDFFLDPQMVAWDFWRWEHPSGYFGIPWVNYLGWFGTAAIITFLVNPPKLNAMPLALVYGIVWFLQSFGQAVFWGQVGPALVGCILMGSVMLLAFWQSRKRAA